jgi:hypothetical protein
MTRDQLNARVIALCDVAHAAAARDDNDAALLAVEEICQTMLAWSRQFGILSQAEIKRVILSPHLQSMARNLAALRDELDQRRKAAP